MYYTIENCMFTDREKKYADIDELFSFLMDMKDNDWGIDNAFEQYLEEHYEPVVLLGETIPISSALCNLRRHTYLELRNDWFSGALEALQFTLTECKIPENGYGYSFFGYTIHVYEGDVPPIKVYCKDTREDVDSVYLHGVYDSTEEAKEAVRELNDFAILNLLNERYFIAEKSFHPTLAQINVQL